MLLVHHTQSGCQPLSAYFNPTEILFIVSTIWLYSIIYITDYISKTKFYFPVGLIFAFEQVRQGAPFES